MLVFMDLDALEGFYSDGFLTSDVANVAFIVRTTYFSRYHDLEITEPSFYCENDISE